MSGSLGHRQRRAARARARRGKPRFNIRDYPNTPPPTVGTVRTWLKRAEAEGRVIRSGVERTGKPGRPAQLWGLPEWKEGQ